VMTGKLPRFVAERSDDRGSNVCFRLGQRISKLGMGALHLTGGVISRADGNRA
jgi:hypothetical protein